MERLFSGVERLFSGVVQRGLEIHENSNYVLSLKSLFDENILPNMISAAIFTTVGCLAQKQGRLAIC